MIILDLYCDGSSDNRKKKDAGWSAALTLEGMKPIIWYGYLETPSTNNQGELLGVMASFAIIKQYQRLNGVCDANITSDSMYALDMLDPTSKSGAAKNIEFISLGIRLLNQLGGKIQTHWVKGHSGHIGNELSDKFAGMGRAQFITKDPRYTTKYFNSKQHIFSHLETILGS